MKRKICSLLALLLVLSILLAGCTLEDLESVWEDLTGMIPGTGSAEAGDDENPPAKNPAGEETEPEVQPIETEAPATEPQETVSAVTDRGEPYMDAIKARHAADTENGYSMWYRGGWEVTSRFCLDYEGYITFEMEASEEPQTGVYNAAVVTADGEITRLRSAVDGRILYDSQEHDGAQIVIPDVRADMMFRDGYLTVVQMTESYDGVSYQLGFLNAQGEWICEPSAHHPILGIIGEEASMEFFEEDLIYFGEGMLAFEGDDDIWRYYNIPADTIVEIQACDSLSAEDVYDEVDCGLLFRDGCSDPAYIKNYTGGTGFYLFHTDGRVEKLSVSLPDKMEMNDHWGEIYYDRGTGIAYFLYAYSSGLSLVDNQGNVIRQIDDVDLIDVNGFKEDGTIQLVTENSEGTAYYTVMDITGQFLFEPVQLPDGADGVFDPDDNDVDVTSTYGYGDYMVISDTGEILHQAEYVNDYSVRNGVVCYYDDEEFYVDISK